MHYLPTPIGEYYECLVFAFLPVVGFVFFHVCEPKLRFTQTLLLLEMWNISFYSLNYLFLLIIVVLVSDSVWSFKDCIVWMHFLLYQPFILAYRSYYNISLKICLKQK